MLLEERGGELPLSVVNWQVVGKVWWGVRIRRNAWTRERREDSGEALHWTRERPLGLLEPLSEKVPERVGSVHVRRGTKEQGE